MTSSKSNIALSLIIPCQESFNPKLKELLKSIEAQDFQSATRRMEVLVISEGTSESAKAIGIRRAKGEVIGFLASDNILVTNSVLSNLYEEAISKGAVYPKLYHYHNQDLEPLEKWRGYLPQVLAIRKDDVLNRYFSLIGCNDPLAFYMQKCDRRPWVTLRKEKFEDWAFSPYGTTLGDNGFFVKRSEIMETNMDDYYHIDNANELGCEVHAQSSALIWHRTGGNIFKFFIKRYKYGLQHAFNKNRRWHLIDFNEPTDIWRLLCFIFFTVTLIEPLILSVRGYLKIRDKAWFMHPLVCYLTVFTYGCLIFHHGFRRLSQLLFARTVVQKA